MLLSLLVGCKSTYKAKTKSELAEVCHKEFPVSDIVIPEPEKEVIIEEKYIDVIVKDSVDCTDKTGVVRIEYRDRIKYNDTTIYETKFVPDPMASARVRLIADLEKDNDHLKQDLNKSQKNEKKANRRGNWLLILLMLSIVVNIKQLFK